MTKGKNKALRKSNRLWRTFFFVLMLLSVLFLIGTLALEGYAAIAIHPEQDEILFENAGADSVTRFFYHSEDGMPYPSLGAYKAKEWESERLTGNTECFYTPREEIPKHLADAFVAIEDRRFYRHGGVDVLRTGKAVLNHIFHFAPRFGGSTITQQLIKNIGGEKEQTAGRKIREMLRARALERRHSKEEILTAYLNIVPLSGNCIGVGAGSMRYFGKAPSELSLAQAASIAAVTRAPAVYAPELHPEKHLERRNLVLSQMLACGMITDAEYRSALAEPLVLEGNSKHDESVRSWYTETVISDVKEGLIAKGYTATAANALLYQGGLKIYTAMDPAAQSAAEDYFENMAHFEGYGDGFCASMVLISPETGNLLAVIGNCGIKKGDLLLNHAVKTLRAPGSALKPIALYAPAIEEGVITEATVFDDVPQSFTGQSYWPHNSPDIYQGLIGTADALALSKNTVAVSLYEKMGAEHIYAWLNRFGIDTLCRRETDALGNVFSDLAPAPLALGELTRGVSLRTLTRAYLPLANNGMIQNVRSYLLVLDRDGNVLLSNEEQPMRLLKEETASVMTHMLSRVTEEGSAKSLTLPQIVDTAGKTGTSSAARDRFFIGYTPSYLCGVWCGYESGNRSVGGKPHLDAFDAVMKTLYKERYDEAERHFEMAKGLTAVRVCRDSGARPSPLCALDARGERTVTVWLEKDAVPHTMCAVHKAYYYSEEGDGIVLDAATHTGALKRIALVQITNRAFPVDIPIGDAEYTCRPMGDALPSKKDEAFYATLLPEGVFAGKAPHGERPYNALAKSTVHMREEYSEGERIPHKAPPNKGEPLLPFQKQERRKNTFRKYFHKIFPIP